MKRLPHEIERKLLAVMQENGPVRNPQQARFDFAGILERLPTMIAHEQKRGGSGGHKKPIRILAGIAADTYFTHTGKGPGRSGSNTGSATGLRRESGRYPRFVALLADAAGLEFDFATLPSTCREVQRALNKQAGLPPLPRFEKDDPNNRTTELIAKRLERAPERTNLLAPHVWGYTADGEPILEGYEPARDPDVSPADTFAHIKQPSS